VIAGHSFRRIRCCSGRTSSTWRVKQVLATLILVGALSSLTVGGTFALLSSQESNAQGFVSSGTLTLGNTVGTTGTTCFSYGAGSTGNVNSACDALFTSAAQNYPGAPATVEVTITNNGSIDASDLSVYMPSCTNAVTPGAPAPGGGDPCAVGGAQFYIQETDASWAPTTCRFLGSTPCTFSDDSLNLFSANANSPATALDLGAGPAHGQSRYFVIGMQLPSNASNTLQGQTAQFGLTWHLTS
jgi:hypothetical protein